MNRVYASIAALLVAGTVVMGHRQLLQPMALTTRDHTDSYLRTQQYARELADGHWPQTLPDAVRGGGSAFPRYYPPLSQWTAVGLYAITADVVAATHLAGLASIVLASLACFLALRLLGTEVFPASVGSALYALLPYPWVALNIRGAFAEVWALVFYPLILAAVVLSLRRKTPVWWLPLAVAGSAASHLIMTAWAIPVVALFGLVVTGLELRWSGVWRTTAAGVLGIGLMGFFILPPLFEAENLRLADPVLMRATPEALASVFWRYYEAEFRSFRWWNQVEWLMLGAGLIGLWRTRKDATPARRICWTGLAAFAGLALLARAPVEVWRLVPQSFRYIQFPERLIGIGGLFLAVTLAAAMSWLRSSLGRIVLTGLGAVITLYAYHLGRQALPRSGETHAQVLAKLHTSYPDRGLSVAGEYLPLGVQPESLAAAIEHTRKSVGQGQLRSWTKEEGDFTAEVVMSEPGEVVLPLVAYDFHRVTSEAGVVQSGAKSGQLTAHLGTGMFRLRVGRRWPVSSRLGLLVSLFSLVAWTVLVRRLRVTAESAQQHANSDRFAAMETIAPRPGRYP